MSEKCKKNWCRKFSTVLDLYPLDGHASSFLIVVTKKMPAETRSLTQSLNKPYDKQYCVETIARMLDAVHSVHGRERRTQKASELFAFLAENRSFVFAFPKFRQTVFMKLVEFLVLHPERPTQMLVRKFARDIFCMSLNEFIDETLRMHANDELYSSSREFVLTPERIAILKSRKTE